MKNVMVKWLALFMCLSMSFGHVSVVSASVYGKAGGPAAVTEEEKDVTCSADEADSEAPARTPVPLPGSPENVPRPRFSENRSVSLRGAVSLSG